MASEDQSNHSWRLTQLTVTVEGPARVELQKMLQDCLAMPKRFRRQVLGGLNPEAMRRERLFVTTKQEPSNRGKGAG